MSRRSVCNNNQHQLSLALVHHEQGHGEYLGYANSIPGNDGERHLVSWVPLLSGYIERSDIYEMWGPGGIYPGQVGTFPHPTNPQATVTEQAPRINLLVCPGDDRSTDEPFLSYVVNAGVPDVGDWGELSPPRMLVDDPANGIFHRRTGPQSSRQGPTVTSDYVKAHDGLSTTVLLTENVNAGTWPQTAEYLVAATYTSTVAPLPGGGYAPATATLTTPSGQTYEQSFASFQPNHDLAEGVSADTFGGQAWLYGRASSFHPGGMMVSFADGHQKFISDDIDYLVWIALCTPDGAGFVVEPTGRGSPDIVNAIRATVVDDSDF